MGYPIIKKGYFWFTRSVVCLVGGGNWGDSQGHTSSPDTTKTNAADRVDPDSTLHFYLQHTLQKFAMGYQNVWL